MDNIRSTRTELGLNQVELARLLGLHQSTISRFESGDLSVDGRTRLALDALLMRAAATDSEQQAA
jgi:transcriptional regulator with XRE-family HTH domain